jgi:formate hydrogenlyase transcriptional activator
MNRRPDSAYGPHVASEGDLLTGLESALSNADDTHAQSAERFRTAAVATLMQRERTAPMSILEYHSREGSMAEESSLSPCFNGRDAFDDPPDGIISHSPALCDALDRINRVASTNATVLITGETGTGKELVARAIHRRSRRAMRPLLAVHLAAIPESLMASELFGYEPGAFTGAAQRRIGRFEQAHHATLFLDEVGELSNEMQVALLRVVQEGTFERLGASQTRQVDVRVIAATNRALETEVDRQRFRADLYYRLSVFPIHLPPLRERPEDIPALVEHFLRDIGRRIDREFTGIERASLERLQAFSWPGNIRQLENIIEQAAILCDDLRLHVPASLVVERPSTRLATSRLAATLCANEQQLIEEALAAAGGRVAGRAGAAARLGLSASTLESKIRRLGIDKTRFQGVRGMD